MTGPTGQWVDHGKHETDAWESPDHPIWETPGIESDHAWIRDEDAAPAYWAQDTAANEQWLANLAAVGEQNIDLLGDPASFFDYDANEELQLPNYAAADDEAKQEIDAEEAEL